MSTITQPEADVVVLGAGQMSGTIAVELSLAGYKVVCLEKGPYFDYETDFVPTNVHDEWAVSVEHKYDAPMPIGTFILRNNTNQMALPVRRYTPVGQQNPIGGGVGGMGLHYGGQMARMSPWSYAALSNLTSRYGQAALATMLPANHDLEDWPWTYNDLIPYYQMYETAYGTSGTNQEPFTPNSTYPVPPHPPTPLATLFQSTVEGMGYHPFPHISNLTAAPYMNRYGIVRNACIHCGFCSASQGVFYCETGAKASSHVCTFPAALNTGNLTLNTYSYVFRINLNSAGTLATGVSYYDAQGNINIQPAKVVYNGLWGYNLIRMLQLSGVGQNYNPTTVTGSVGRAAEPSSNPPTSSASGTIALGANSYSAGAHLAGGYDIEDFKNDNFDHTGLNFISGTQLNCGNYTGDGPNYLYTITPGPTNFGSAWKATLKDIKLPTKQTVSLGGAGPVVPEQASNVDLDPNYNDIYGDPLPRITWDYGANGAACATYLLPYMAQILTKMGATNVTQTTQPSTPPFSSHNASWTVHVRGGARTGLNQSTSVFNKWMQAWTVENVFAGGEITDTWGDESPSGTHIAAPMSYVAADGIKTYLQTPGSLV